MALRNTTRRSDQAFTLVELLVVIAIISLLITILLPAITKIRNQARIAMCASNLHQIQLGMATYAINNDGWYPLPNPTGAADGLCTINWLDGGNVSSAYDNFACLGDTTAYIIPGQAAGIGWMIGRQASVVPTAFSGNGAQPYVTNWRVFYCPTIGNRYVDDTSRQWWTNDDTANGVHHRPSISTGDYSMRSSNYVQWNAWASQYLGYVAKKMTDPAGLVLTGDKLAWYTLGNYWLIYQRGSVFNNLYTNHPTGANYVYNDGHVEFKIINLTRGASLAQQVGFRISGASNTGNTQQWYAMPDTIHGY